MELSGQKALVTGASKGIGKAIALALAEAGADVALNYHSGSSDAEALADRIGDMGRDTILLPADIGKPAEIGEMFESLHKNWKALDILVNCAGISPAKPFLDFSVEEIEEVVSINLTGAMFCAQEALKDMVNRGKGRIINISSVHSISCDAKGRTPYAAAKSGMNGLTRALAVEFGPLGICCNSLIVGAVAVERTVEEMSQPANKERIERTIPVGRWGTPEEIARYVRFLADPESGFINGACLSIDGGRLVAL